MINWKNTLIYTVVIVAITASATRYYFPQVQEKTRVEEKEVIKRDIRTIIKEVTRPDGSKEIVTEIVDNTKETIKKEYEHMLSKPKDWLVSGGAVVRLDELKPVYQVRADRRIMGPVFVGASVTTNKEVGLHIGLEF